MGIIARQSIKGTIVTYIGVAVGFFTTFFVLTRFLTAEEIGLARVLLDAATLFVGLAQLGTTSSVIRFFPYFRSEGRTHGFFFWSLLVPLAGFAVFSLVFLAFRTPVEAWFGEKSPLFVDYWYFVLPIAFFMLYQTVFETCSNVCMRIVVPRAVREVGVRIGLLVCYLCYAFRLLSMDGFVLSLCAVYALAALTDLVYFFAIGKVSLRPDLTFLRGHRQLVRSFLLYTAFLIASSLASALAPVLSSFFITAKMGLDYTGIFAIATYMAVMVSIPYRSLTAIAAPQLAAAIKDGDRPQTSALMQQVTTNALLVGCAIFLLIWLNIDLVYHLLPNGATYSAARSAVFLLGLSQLLIATFSFSLSALNYSRFYAFTLLFSALLTVAAIVLNNMLIPPLGMTGAALANLLSYVLYFILILLTVHRAVHVSPFARAQARILYIFVAVLVLNCAALHFMSGAGVWLSALVRTALLFGMFAWLAYRLKLSPEINALLHSVFILRH
ncbi:MAG: lipopolysaccharide biosynthesis protein [Paludibacteraceae bacterium]|nr:lipopolysaccharide biosynthesis protein [Paludibacteraceae bacterium]